MQNQLIVPYRVVYLDKVDSTNFEVRRHIEHGADSGLWVVADCQTNGRGRRGREWQSARGNFFGSLYLKLSVDQKIWSELSFVAALAVRETMEELAEENGDVLHRGEVRLKWPNDVLFNGKKVAGLLLESGTGPLIEGVILGIGINLSHSPKNTPYEVTSLLEETGVLVLPNKILPKLTEIFDRYYNQWLSQGFPIIRDAWTINATGINKPAKVNLVNESFEGVFLGLSDDGGARIQLDDGSERIVLAGDIFPLV